MTDPQRSGRSPLHGAVEIGAVLVVVGLIAVLWVFGPAGSVSSIEPTSPAPTSSQAARIEAARIQAQATENTGVRTTRVAVVAGTGILAGLLISFLNYNREQRRDAEDYANASEERRHEIRRYHLERYSQAIDHLKDPSPIVRAGGVKALEMLAEEPDGPRDEVLAVINAKRSEDGAAPSNKDDWPDDSGPEEPSPDRAVREARGSDVPVDVQAARDAWERLGPHGIFVIATIPDLETFAKVLARWCRHVVPDAKVQVFAPRDAQSLEHDLRFRPPRIALFVVDPETGRMSKDGEDWWFSRGPANAPKLWRKVAAAKAVSPEMAQHEVLAADRTSLRDLAISFATSFGPDVDLGFLGSDAEASVCEQLATVAAALQVNRGLSGGA